MCTYLQPHYGTYYFRRAIPAEIRHLFPTASGKPRTQWRWSLRVKNREDAKRLLPRHVAKTNAWVDQARAAMAAARVKVDHAPTDEQLLAAQNVASRMELDSIEASEFFASHYAEQEDRAEADPDFALSFNLRAAQGRELSRLKAAEHGRELAAQLRDERCVSLRGLFEQYAATPGRHAKTIAQWRPYIEDLITFIGDDNVFAVTHDKLVAWRNHLRDVKTYRGKRLSPKTINGSYLGATGALFAWAKGDGLIQVNPMREVARVGVLKVAQTRFKAFTVAEAHLILKATLERAEGREGADLRNAKRWCPWLMAYSGARVNEITQLRKQDIETLEGVPIMRLTPDAGTLKSKTARMVPLHRDLIAQGFLEFVSQRSEGPLFSSPGKRRSDVAINRQANRLGSKLAEWVRSLGITEVLPNHAWRHLFASLAVRYQLDPRTTKAIMGHAATDEHSKYIAGFVDVLSRDVEKLPSFELAD
jgi:integrase